jgi:hypothetical protein
VVLRDVSRWPEPDLAVVESSRGAAAGDLGGDGGEGLFFANEDAPPTLLRDDGARQGNWLLVDAPGALRATLEFGGKRRVREAARGGSYVWVSDARIHFGPGRAPAVDALSGAVGFEREGVRRLSPAGAGRAS